MGLLVEGLEDYLIAHPMDHQVVCDAVDLIAHLVDHQVEAEEQIWNIFVMHLLIIKICRIMFVMYNREPKRKPKDMI